MIINTGNHLLDKIFTSNTFNFIIVLVFLCAIYKYAKIGNMLTSAIENVSKKIKEADETVESANKKLESAKTKLENAPEDIKSIEKTSRRKTHAFCQRINKNTEFSINLLNNNVEKSISIEEKKISNAIIKNTVKNSVDEARNNLIKLLNENPDLHNDFIENSLDELDKVNL